MPLTPAILEAIFRPSDRCTTRILYLYVPKRDFRSFSQWKSATILEFNTLISSLHEYWCIKLVDKFLGHTSTYYVRNKSLKVKTRCKKRVFANFPLFSYQNFRKIYFYVTKVIAPGSGGIYILGKIPAFWYIDIWAYSQAQICVITVKNTPKISGKENSSGMTNWLAYDILFENRLIRRICQRRFQALKSVQSQVLHVSKSKLFKKHVVGP